MTCGKFRSCFYIFWPIRVKAFIAEERSFFDATVQSVVGPGNIQAKKHAVIADSRWDVFESVSCAQHVIQGIHEKSLSRVARSPKHVQSGRELEFRRLLVR